MELPNDAPPQDLSTNHMALLEVQASPAILPKQSAPPASTPRDATAGLPSLAISTGNMAMDFGRGLGQSFLHTVVQSPLEGAAQTFDHTVGETFGSNLFEKTKDLIVSEPKAAVFGTAEWHGQSIGGALGIVPWFIATRSVVRGGAGVFQTTRGLVVSQAEAAVSSKLLSSTAAKLVLEGGTTGAAYAGVLKPVDPGSDNYWSAKSATMAGDFATFATLTAGSLALAPALKSATLPLIEKYPGASRVTQAATSILAGGLSGIPAAGVETVAQYLQSGDTSNLSMVQFGKNVYSYGIVGGALGAGHFGAAKSNAAKLDVETSATKPQETLPPNTVATRPSGAGESPPPKTVDAHPTEAGESPTPKTVDAQQNQASEPLPNNPYPTQPNKTGDKPSDNVPDISTSQTAFSFVGEPSSNLRAKHMDSMSTLISSLGSSKEYSKSSKDRFDLGNFLSSIKAHSQPLQETNWGSENEIYFEYPDLSFDLYSSHGHHNELKFKLPPDSIKTHLDTDIAWKDPEENVSSIARTSEIASLLHPKSNAFEFKQALYDRAVGSIPEPFLKAGLSEDQVVEKLDSLANALRALDAPLPPQKKFGLGAEDLSLPAFNVGLGDSTMLVSKVGIGEVAHVYKVSIDGRDFAFKVPNDPGRMDVHGSYAETAAFVSLADEKISDLIDFHAAHPGPEGGWMLSEFVSKPVERSGRPLADVLAERGLTLGDDWSANRGPGNVVWDLGGVEPKGVTRPKSLDQLKDLLETPEGQIIAGRKLDGIKNQAELKEALMLCFQHSALGGQVARTAAMRLSNPADLADVLSRALEIDGAAGRAAFELDTLANTPFATSLFYKALQNPQSRAEAAKQIDKLSPQDRKAAFDAALIYPEARAMAARSISSIPNEVDRADASAAASAFPGSNFVRLHHLSKVRALTAEEQADQQRAFEEHFENYGLTTGNKLKNDVPPLTIAEWWSAHKDEPYVDLRNGPNEVKNEISEVWDQLKESHKALPAEQLHTLSTSWYILDRKDWHSMTAQEAAEHALLVQDLDLYGDQSRTALKWPDFKVWWKENRSSISSAEDHYQVRELIDRWPELPADYKKLGPKSLLQISDAWNSLFDGEWSKIPASSAVAVARTISDLHLDHFQATAFVRSPDLANWLTDNFAAVTNMRREDARSLINAWGKLTPEQKAMSPEELVTLGKTNETRSKLESVFGPGSATVEYLFSPESIKHNNPTMVLDWLKSIMFESQEACDKGKELVEQMAREGTPFDSFQRMELHNKVYMNILFPDKPQFQADLAQRLPDQNGLARILNFVRQDTARNKPLIEFAVKNGFSGSEREFESLLHTSSLASRLNLNHDEANHLLSQRLSGLRLAELENYLSHNPLATGRVKELIQQRADRQSLDARRLLDRDSLATLTDFNPNQMARLDVLQSNGLSAIRLTQHLVDAPEDYPVFQRLLDSGADVKQFNDYMKLSVLPTEVNLKTVESINKGEITTEAVLAGLRDWKSGRVFRDLLINHVESGAELSPNALKDLRSQASSMPATPPTLERVSRGETSLHEAAAQTFVEAVEGIEKAIPADKPIVLLGRDAWPLLPLLRAAGRDAHYFLWSRLQHGDEGTEHQWLKEIPPNAAVIDSGYSGSIIDKIRTIDPGVSGYLMSTSDDGRYPRLLTSSIHSMKVGQIEGFPKLIHRSSSHNALGNAIARRKGWDEDTDSQSSLELSSRWYIERRSRELLRAAGLPQWDVWRYSQFTGLTPTERLGAKNEDEVAHQYQSVEQARALDAEQARARRAELARALDAEQARVLDAEKSNAPAPDR